METTREAFESLTNQRNWYEGLGVNASSARSLKKYYAENRLSEAKMEEMLHAAGYRVIQEKIWSKNIETAINSLQDLTAAMDDLSKKASLFGISVKLFAEKLEKTS